MVQLSHLYMTTAETIGLTMQTFAGKVMSLLFNVLSRFVIAFHCPPSSVTVFGKQAQIRSGRKKLKLKSNKRWYGEGGRRGVQDWERMYTRGGFKLMYGKTKTVL